MKTIFFSVLVSTIPRCVVELFAFIFLPFERRTRPKSAFIIQQAERNCFCLRCRATTELSVQVMRTKEAQHWFL